MRRAPLLSCLLWTSVTAGCGDTESFIDAGLLPPNLDFSSGTISFGLTDCGTTPDPETLEITNTGDADVTWSAEIEGAGFAIVGADSGTVAPGETGSITVAPDAIPATATAATPIIATLRVDTNTSAGEVEVDLSITPRGGAITLSPTTADFGTTPVSTSAVDVDVMVSNTGNLPLGLTIDDAAGDEFTLAYPGSPGEVTLPAGGNFTLTADFNPLATAGTRDVAAAMAITGVQCQGAIEVPMTGISSTGTLSFGAFPAMDADCGEPTPPTQDLTITNTSTTSSVTISAAEATGGFTVTSTLPITIGPSSTGTLTVRPPASVIGTDVGGGTKTGLLSFTTNETGNPTHESTLTSTVVGANLVFTDPSDTTPISAVALDADLSCPGPRSVFIRNTGNAPVDGFFRSGSDDNFAFQQDPSSTVAAADFTSTTIAAFTSSACTASDTLEYVWSSANVCTTSPAVLSASFTITGQSFCFCS